MPGMRSGRGIGCCPLFGEPPGARRAPRKMALDFLLEALQQLVSLVRTLLKLGGTRPGHASSAS